MAFGDEINFCDVCFGCDAEKCLGFYFIVCATFDRKFGNFNKILQKIPIKLFLISFKFQAFKELFFNFFSSSIPNPINFFIQIALNFFLLLRLQK